MPELNDKDNVFVESIRKRTSIEESSRTTLYHYTTEKGLYGIVQDNCFWATHFKFFNDPTEILFGVEYIRNSIGRMIKEERDERKKSILTEFVYQVIDLVNFVSQYWDEYYIISFSENPDLLSQWRAYGDNGNGYSIGLDMTNQSLSESVNRYGLPITAPISKPTLIRIQYGEQPEIIDELYSCLVSKIEELIDLQDNTIIKRLKEHYLQWFVNLPLIFKDPAYIEEKEWRLITHRGGQFINLNNYDVKIANLSKGKTPYVTFSFNKTEPYCPIEKIYLGPKQKHAKYRVLVQHLFFQNGYECHPEIKESTIP